jgi:hypothetical protein
VRPAVVDEVDKETFDIDERGKSGNVVHDYNIAEF